MLKLDMVMHKVYHIINELTIYLFASNDVCTMCVCVCVFVHMCLYVWWAGNEKIEHLHPHTFGIFPILTSLMRENSQMRAPCRTKTQAT